MSKPTRVYIAGPMAIGSHMSNIRAGIDMWERLHAAGLFPYLPHLNSFISMLYSHSWEEWLEQDEHWLSLCHALIRLPGESKGADREVEFAQERGIAVFHSVEELLAWVKEQR